MRCLRIAAVALILSACATSDYVTHYGIFEAENSAGEVRLFRVYWQTVRDQGWSGDRYRAFPLVLETQCSERDLRFYDASFGSGRRCLDTEEDGIHFCARSRTDEDRRGRALPDRALCGVVTDRNGAKDILSLEGEILITLDCRPKQTEKIVASEKVNTDFLMGSSIPYIVSTKIVKGQDIDKILPAVSNHSSICDPDY
ncbi:MAG: hypothetical protein C9356_13710 [Oleiphilus sp.]|nr:MAG: hypothetical protein C9356_13710 [Oleiphilus sp.]